MASIYILIPVSMLLLAIACWGFFYAVNSGQMDDLDEIGKRMPDDEDQQAP